MKPLELLDQTISRDATVLKLVRRGEEFLILADDQPLMSSRMHGSEEALAAFACSKAKTLRHPTVLIGGLGMGFTLRSALDLLPRSATVVVVELLPAVVAWNRGPLRHLAAHPLNDRRVQIEVADVALTLRSAEGRFDAVLLDVDNGPAAFTTSSNAALYDTRGLTATFTALKPSGTLAIWSARDDQKFAQRLRRAGFAVKVQRVRGRDKKGGARHTIFLGHKPSNSYSASSG